MGGWTIIEQLQYYGKVGEDQFLGATITNTMCCYLFKLFQKENKHLRRNYWATTSRQCNNFAHFLAYQNHGAKLMISLCMPYVPMCIPRRIGKSVRAETSVVRVVMPLVVRVGIKKRYRTDYTSGLSIFVARGALGTKVHSSPRRVIGTLSRDDGDVDEKNGT